MMIGKWREAFRNHYSLLVVPVSDNTIRIERRYGEHVEDYLYEDDQCLLYLFLAKPRTLEECDRQLSRIHNIGAMIES